MAKRQPNHFYLFFSLSMLILMGAEGGGCSPEVTKNAGVGSMAIPSNENIPGLFYVDGQVGGVADGLEDGSEEGAADGAEDGVADDAEEDGVADDAEEESAEEGVADGQNGGVADNSDGGQTGGSTGEQPDAPRCQNDKIPTMAAVQLRMAQVQDRKPDTLADCTHLNSDPLGLANAYSVFIDIKNCNCSDAYTKEQARNPTTPWCSFKMLGSRDPVTKKMMVGQGDEVYFKAGAYELKDTDLNLVDSMSGIAPNPDNQTPAKYTEISAYPAETVTIYLNGEKKNTKIYLGGVGYVKIRDLNFRGYTIDSVTGKRLYGMVPIIIGMGPIPLGGGGYTPDPHHVELINLTISGHIGELNAGRLRGAPSQTVLIQGNNLVVDRVFVKMIDDEETIPCLIGKYGNPRETMAFDGEDSIIKNSYFGGSTHFSLRVGPARNVIIENNLIRNIRHTGLGLLWGENLTVRNNVVADCNTKPADYCDIREYCVLRGMEAAFDKYGYCGDSSGNNLQVQLVNNSQIYNNILMNGRNTGSGLHMGSGDSGNGMGQHNNKIFNNLFYDTAHSNVVFESKAYANSIKGENDYNINNQYYNNIFLGIDNTKFSRAANISIIYYTDYLLNTFYEQSNTIQNNIFYQLKAEMAFSLVYYENQVKPKQLKYNVAQFESAFPAVASGNIEGDPLLADAPGADFRLQGRSPAIGTGLCTPEYLATKDFNGNPRSSQSCDIGPVGFFESCN